MSKKNSRKIKQVPEGPYKSYDLIHIESIDEKIRNFRSLSGGMFSLDASDLLQVEKDISYPLEILNKKFGDRNAANRKNYKINKKALDEIAVLMKNLEELQKKEESAIVNDIGVLEKALEETKKKAKIERTEKDIEEREETNSILGLEI